MQFFRDFSQDTNGRWVHGEPHTLQQLQLTEIIGPKSGKEHAKIAPLSLTSP